MESIFRFISLEDSPLLRGPKFIPLNYIVNAHKGLTLFFCLFLMNYFGNYSLSAFIYTALHGGYGIIWILKDLIFPDASWSKSGSIQQAAAVTLIVASYWYLPYMLISAEPTDISYSRVLFVFLLNLVGNFFMLGSDLQKYVRLQQKKEGEVILINDLFVSYNRNTNYLGEMMIYSSFAFTIDRIEAHLLLWTVWIVVFSGRMYIKDLSLARKANAQEYFNHSYLFLFKILNSHVVSLVVYVGIAAAGYYLITVENIQSVLQRIDTKRLLAALIN